MATTSWQQRTPTTGGKIVKPKKPRPTPYTRPEPDNPNWLSGLFNPAKSLASGVLSFFGNLRDNDDDDISSSSSEYDDDDNENDMSFQEDDQLHKVRSPSSKSDNKCAIEQLVMQEIYSRKEANELIKLIRSRIVDMSGSTGEATPSMRTTAIMEARKWLQEKRLDSNKKLENKLDVSNVASPSQISRNEKGSPVDMARSYMQNRPAWASPSSKYFEAGSSSPFGVLHFKDETPKSTLHRSEDFDAGKHVEFQVSEVAELKYTNNDEVKQSKSATGENGLGGLESGLAEGQDTTHEAQPSEEENENLVASSQGGRENSNTQERPATDSSSMQEELSQDLSQPVAKDSPAAKAKNKPERKTRVSTRRGRGRGK